MSGEGKVVCVTGASRFVASCLVKLLLERGYTVKATVRNLSDPMKVDHLKAFEGAKERLLLFEADLVEDGSFDSVIDGCDGCLSYGFTCCVFSFRPTGDPKKVDHLKPLEGAEERLQLFEAELLEEGSFDSAVDGCEG